MESHQIDLKKEHLAEHALLQSQLDLLRLEVDSMNQCMREQEESLDIMVTTLKAIMKIGSSVQKGLTGDTI